jgi:glutathione-regulated potassium-efflux system protein KefB
MHASGALEFTLIFLLAAVIAVPLFRHFGLGAVLGYLAAGVVIGPAVLTLVSDTQAVLAVSELGVVMMLFVIGLELSPARLWVLRRGVFVVGGLQVLLSAVAIAFTLAIGVSLDSGSITYVTALVIGIALALSSTAVGLQILNERKELSMPYGRAAFAILLFQDLIAIPLLAAIPLLGRNLANEHAQPIWQAGFRAIAVVAAVVFLGRVLLRWLFPIVARVGAVEVFSATALLIVAGTAWLMQWAGLSMGLGAFLAGVLLADSEFRHELESHIEPFKGLFLGLFFIAVGMTIDISLIQREPITIAIATMGLLAIKALFLFPIAHYAGQLNGRQALMLAATLALGGEFAFIVFAEAQKYALIETELRDRLVVVVGLSMAITPLLVELASRWLQAHPEIKATREFDKFNEDTPRVIIAGFGRAGQIVARMLRSQKIPFTAIENSVEQVELSRRFGSHLYYGDPARPDLLRAAHAEKAEIFVLTIEDAEANVRIARVVKRTFPHLKIFAVARNRQHAFKLMDMGVTAVTREAFLSAIDMGRQILQALGLPDEVAAERAKRFREHDEAILHQQFLIYDDEAALIASTQQAQLDLIQLFEADENREGPTG